MPDVEFANVCEDPIDDDLGYERRAGLARLGVCACGFVVRVRVVGELGQICEYAVRGRGRSGCWRVERGLFGLQGSQSGFGLFSL